MPIAIRFSTHGGPEVLRSEELDPGKPAAQEVQVRHTAIGVNYVDVYDRTGLYPVALPSGLGREAAGVVKKIPVQTAPAHNYILGVDFQGDDLWVATAKGLSHGIRLKSSIETAQASSTHKAVRKK